MYELTSYGNRETGEAHYLVDGVEVTESEYHRCLAEYQPAKANQGESNERIHFRTAS
jgi:hypothetical protein